MSIDDNDRIYRMHLNGNNRRPITDEMSSCPLQMAGYGTLLMTWKQKPAVYAAYVLMEAGGKSWQFQTLGTTPHFTRISLKTSK